MAAEGWNEMCGDLGSRRLEQCSEPAASATSPVSHGDPAVPSRRGATLSPFDYQNPKPRESEKKRGPPSVATICGAPLAARLEAMPSSEREGLNRDPDDIRENTGLSGTTVSFHQALTTKDGLKPKRLHFFYFSCQLVNAQ